MKIVIPLSECFIKPKHEVEAAKKRHCLTVNMLAPLAIDSIQKGLLYSLQNSSSTNTTETISPLLAKLKHSLSIALVHFYPLSGRFTTQKYLDENSSSVFLDCTNSPGAKFIHASALQVSVSDIVSSIYVPEIVASFFELGEKSVNYDGHKRALLSVQVTELRDGVFIGFSINHSVCDGTSFIHFVKMVSEIFRSYEEIGDDNSNNTISRVPILYYTPISNEDLVLKLPYSDPDQVIDRGYDPGPLRERIFHFSASSIATLKAKANQECGTHNLISSFQALIGLVWISITRTRNSSPDELTSCSLLVNARSRFDPAVSDDYFGNLLSVTKGVCKVGELLGHDLGRAAMILHKAVKEQDSKTVIDFYKQLTERPMIFPRSAAGLELIIGGSTRFDMYGPEFGLGRAVAVRTGYANKSDAKMCASSGFEVGSVELEICLRPHLMAALESDLDFMSFVS